MRTPVKNECFAREGLQGQGHVATVSPPSKLVPAGQRDHHPFLQQRIDGQPLRIGKGRPDESDIDLIVSDALDEVVGKPVCTENLIRID